MKKYLTPNLLSEKLRDDLRYRINTIIYRLGTHEFNRQQAIDATEQMVIDFYNQQK